MSEKQIAIEVVYCADCGYLPRTLWMLSELMTDIQFMVSDVKLIPDTKGLFEWSVNGDLVYSKAAMGRFPDMDELREIVYGYLE